MSFCIIGISSVGTSTPKSPLATIKPSETCSISSRFSTPSWFSILDIICIWVALLFSNISLIANTSEAFLTKDAAIKSISCSIPNSISLISFGVKAGKLIFTPGKLTPLWFLTIPEFSTVHIMSLPFISFILNPTRPSSISIVSPTFTSLTNSL